MQSWAFYPPCYHSTIQSEICAHARYGADYKLNTTERWGSLVSVWQSHRFELQTELDLVLPASRISRIPSIFVFNMLKIK